MKRVGTTVQTAGFTIVELATVILVIGILATLVTMGYAGLQERARDSTRVSDMKTLAKALDVHKSRNGSFPDRSPSASSWASSHLHPTDYISGIAGSGLSLKTLPIDPVNDSTYRYVYDVYPAESYGCDKSLGSYYVLFIPRMETVPAGSAHPDSPGFSCSGRNWATESGGAAWVQGGFIYS